MVEEARDIRDRGYLAINLLLGGIAVAVGLFNMFVLRNFGAASMFDAFLGLSMITVGSLFIAPYMAPRQLGLPAPGVRMTRRPYLPYPVPLPVEEGEEGEPSPVPEGDEELPMLPSPVRRPSGVAARPSPTVAISGARATPRSAVRRPSPRPATSTEAASTLAELEALGVVTAPTAAAVAASLRPQPLRLPPYLPEQPPPADYLEESEPAPSSIPELEPQFKKALEDLAGAASQRTDGARPLVLVNGKPPETTLSILEEVLRQPPPFEGEVRPLAQPRPEPVAQSASAAPGEALSEVDHLELELQSMPRVDEALAHPPALSPAEPVGAPDSEPVEVAATPVPVLESPGPQAEVSPEAAPSPEPSIPPESPETVTGSEAALVASPPTGTISAEQAAEIHEGQLEEMTRALEGMVSALRASEPTAPASELSLPSAASTPEVDVPPAPETSETPPTPESFSEDTEPAPAIDDLERQLAAMRSALGADLTSRLPPGSSSGEGAGTGTPRKATQPLLPATPVSQPLPAVPMEEDLQRVLDEAESAAKLAEDRHKVPEKKRRK